MSIDALIHHWKNDPTIIDNISVWRITPARQANYVPLPDDIHPLLTAILHKQGISNLYSHQRDSWLCAKEHRNFIVTTPTASGKTLCYNLPVLDSLLKNPEDRALYLFPTKALTQDQATILSQFIPEKHPTSEHPPITLGIYDGDTPLHKRTGIRQSARIILTNPDMLHVGILPSHTQWVNLFSHLRWVILDEAHVYRGIFGSHVANIIRRIKRIAKFHGSNPQFILASATIANPIEHAQRLIGSSIVLINEDGSARGPQHFVIYNPPIINAELGLRQSLLQEGLRLAGDLLSYNIQTILFGRSRHFIEVILKYLRDTPNTPICNVDSLVANQLHGYRSGYLPKERRAIEQGLRQGTIRGVVATNALELGIDIGSMEASVLIGYPGTIASTRQQAGRAGRKDSPSIAILIAGANPLDQFLAHHPDYFFERTPENALIAPNHPLVLLNHLLCAVHELPFRQGESFGEIPYPQLVEYFDYLIAQGMIQQEKQSLFWVSSRNPAASISIRHTGAERVMIQNGDKVIGEVDKLNAPRTVYPGAIYLHEANTYLVESLNLEENVAWVNRTNLDYYTEPQSDTKVQLQERKMAESVLGGEKAFGELVVTSQVVGFRKIQWYSHAILSQERLDLPATNLHTEGYWVSLLQATLESLRSAGLWRNDRNDYGPNWEQIRYQARQRDSFTCQVCGTPEADQAHHVHHITPFRAFTNPKEANQIDNLITVCPACHRRIEAVVQIRSGLAGLAFALGHLAPLFLMCDTSDIGVHSDPQSPLAEGRPTVIIYDNIAGGFGLSLKLYEIHEQLVKGTLDHVLSCECEDGCPSCVGPAGEGGYGGKRETIAILESLCSDCPNG